MSDRVHWVVPGDTLSALALRYGSTVAALVRANNIANPDRIYVGQRLVIPTASPAASSGAGSASPAPAVPAAAQGTRPGETEIRVTDLDMSLPPSASRACPTWWPDAACHMWGRVPVVLAVIAAGAVLIAVSRRSASPPQRAKKRRR